MGPETVYRCQTAFISLNIDCTHSVKLTLKLAPSSTSCYSVIAAKRPLTVSRISVTVIVLVRFTRGRGTRLE